MIDWPVLLDPGVEVAELLDRAEREPSTKVWERLDELLIVEAECWYSAGFAALPRLSALAQSGAAEHRSSDREPMSRFLVRGYGAIS